MAREVTHLQIDGIWIDCSVRETHSLQASVTKHNVEDGADVTDHVRTQPDALQLEGIVSNTPLEQPMSHTGGAILDTQAIVELLDADGQRIRRLQQVGTFDYPLEGEPMLGVFSVVPFAGEVLAALRVGNFIPHKRLNIIVPLDKAVTSNVLFGTGPRFNIDMARTVSVADALRATFLARKPIQVVTAMRRYENCILTDLQIEREASRGQNLFFSASCEVIRIVKSQTGLAGPTKPVQTRAKAAINTGPQNTVPTAPGEVPAKAKSFGTAAWKRLTGQPPDPPAPASP